ncbi:MAG: hypothetical protein WKF84_05490 [Pyrinomonadaceae bacterium]
MIFRSCQSIVSYLEGIETWTPAAVAEEKPGGVSSVVNPSHRAASILPISFEARIEEEFDQKINTFIKPLVKKIWGVNLMEHAGTHVVRYQPGDFTRCIPMLGLE